VLNWRCKSPSSCARLWVITCMQNGGFVSNKSCCANSGRSQLFNVAMHDRNIDPRDSHLTHHASKLAAPTIHITTAAVREVSKRIKIRRTYSPLQTFVIPALTVHFPGLLGPHPCSGRPLFSLRAAPFDCVACFCNVHIRP
jgi:hypothetical protein